MPAVLAADVTVDACRTEQRGYRIRLLEREFREGLNCVIQTVARKRKSAPTYGGRV